MVLLFPLHDDVVERFQMDILSSQLFFSHTVSLTPTDNRRTNDIDL